MTCLSSIVEKYFAQYLYRAQKKSFLFVVFCCHFSVQREHWSVHEGYKNGKRFQTEVIYKGNKIKKEVGNKSVPHYFSFRWHISLWNWQWFDSTSIKKTPLNRCRHFYTYIVIIIWTSLFSICHRQYKSCAALQVQTKCLKIHSTKNVPIIKMFQKYCMVLWIGNLIRIGTWIL